MTPALLALLLAAAPSHVGVNDFQSTSELAPLAGALSGLVANELTRMGAFQVTSASQVSDLMSLDRQKQLLGCTTDECLAGASIDLGFDFFVTGTLTRYGAKGPLTLELKLRAPKSGARTASDLVKGQDEA